jgi:hypothetical protein
MSLIAEVLAEMLFVEEEEDDRYYFYNEASKLSLWIFFKQ